MKKAETNRVFKEVEGGKYDKFGFYHTPNGSFWDCDGVYFNREGVDVHGGTYDDKMEYHPGEGWIDSLMCYEDEIDPNNQNMNIGKNESIDGEDYEDGDYDVYEDIQDDLREGIGGVSYYDAVEKGGKRLSDDKSKGNNKVPTYKPIKLDNSSDKNQYSANSAYNEKPQLTNKPKETSTKEPKGEHVKGYIITEDLLSDEEDNTNKGKKK